MFVGGLGLRRQPEKWGAARASLESLSFADSLHPREAARLPQRNRPSRVCVSSGKAAVSLSGG